MDISAILSPLRPVRRPGTSEQRTPPIPTAIPTATIESALSPLRPVRGLPPLPARAEPKRRHLATLSEAVQKVAGISPCKCRLHCTENDDVLWHLPIRILYLDSLPQPLKLQVLFFELLSFRQERYEDGTVTLIYRIGREVVCQRAWQTASRLASASVTKLTQYALSVEPHLHSKDLAQDKQAKRKVSRFEQSFVDAFTQIVEDFGDKMPHLPLVKNPQNKSESECQVFLPGGLFATQKDVFNELLETGEIPYVHLSTFYRWWQLNFYFVVLRKYIPFAKCDDCVSYRQRILIASPEERLELRKEQKEHRDVLSLFRAISVLRDTAAECLKEDILKMTLDGMDQSKLGAPHLGSLTHSKRLDKEGKPLKVSLLGCIVAGLGFFGLWTVPRYPHGANLQCSGIILVLNKLLRKYGKLPPHLVLQLDNCGRENKNVTVFALLSYLIKLGVFKSITLTFLPVGHTHTNIDQYFSRVSSALCGRDALDLPSLIDATRHLFVNNGFVEHLVIEDIADYTKFFEGTLHKIGGQGTVRIANKKRRLHLFRFEKHRGFPAIKTKEFDVPKHGWKGLWDSGINEPLTLFKPTADFPSALELAPRRPNKDWAEVVKRADELLAVLSEKQPTRSFVPTLKRQEHLRGLLPSAQTWWTKYKEQEDKPWEQNREMLPLYQWPNTRAGALSPAALAAITAIDDGCTAALPPSVPERLRSAITAAREQEEGLGVDFDADIADLRLYYLRNKPVSKSTFVPALDTQPDMTVLLMFPIKEGTHLDRGWEIARVLQVNAAASTLNVEYLAPTNCNDPDDPKPWPQDWISQRLVGMKIRLQTRGRSGRGQVSTYVENDLDLDLVMWGTWPNRNKTLPAVKRNLVIEQIKRIEAAFARNQPRSSVSRVSDSLPGFVDDDDDNGEILAADMEPPQEEYADEEEDDDADSDYLLL